MVRQLTESDRAVLLAFAYKKPAIRTFLIGDIENFGVEHEDLTYWGQFEDGKLMGVLLRYFKFFMAYYQDVSLDIMPFIQILKDYPGEISTISGENAVIQQFAPHFMGANIEKTLFCELKSQVKPMEDSAVRLATLDDVDTVYNLLVTIPEFAPPIKDTLVKTLELGAGRIYMLTDDNKGDAISIAQTTAENSASAMIIGVCTHKDHRQKGYMRRVMSRLCTDLQAESKALSLFYSNPEAGKIYHSMGFETTGDWTMMKF